MYKKIFKYIIIIAIVIIIASLICIVYSISNKPDDNLIYSKVDQELKYLDKTLLSTINNLNNLDKEYLITNNYVNSNSNSSSNSSDNNSNNSAGGNSNNNSDQSNSSSDSKSNNITISTIDSESIILKDKNDIDWTYIKSEVEKINNSWSVMTIDLNSINISNENILLFNSNIDNLLRYAKAEDKQNSIISIANLYALLPKYKEEYSENNKEKEVLYIKSNIVSSYALLETQNWDEISKLLGDADSRISALMNSADNANNQNLQKSYVLLKDFIKSVNDKDIDLCYMKYYYLITELQNC